MKRIVIQSILFIIIASISVLLYIYGQSHQILLDFPAEILKKAGDSAINTIQVSNIFEEPKEYYRVTIDKMNPIDIVAGDRAIVFVKGPKHTIFVEYIKDGIKVQFTRSSFKLDSFYSFIIDVSKLISNEEKWISKYIVEDQVITETNQERESFSTSTESIEFEKVVPSE